MMRWATLWSDFHLLLPCNVVFWHQRNSEVASALISCLKQKKIKVREKLSYLDENSAHVLNREQLSSCFISKN